MPKPNALEDLRNAKPLELSKDKKEDEEEVQTPENLGIDTEKLQRLKNIGSGTSAPAPTPEEEPTIVDEVLDDTGEYFQGVGERASGIGEAGLTVASAMFSSVLGSLSATGGLLFHSLRQAGEEIEKFDNIDLSGGNIILDPVKANQSDKEAVERLRKEPPLVEGGAALFTSIYHDVSERFTYTPEQDSGKAIVHGIEKAITAPGKALGETGFQLGEAAKQAVPGIRNLDPQGFDERQATIATAFKVIPDAMLMLAGVRIARSQGSIKTIRETVKAEVDNLEGLNIKHAERFEPVAMANGEANPAGLSAGKIRLEALERLPGAEKPKFRNPEEAAAYIDALANNKIIPVITVETVGGAPTKIVSGAEVIHFLRARQSAGGISIRDVKVKTYEAPKVDKLTAEQKAANADSSRKAFSAFTESQDAAVRLAGEQRKAVVDKVMDGIVDASGSVKRELIREAGSAGELAVRKFELIAGAHPRAYYRTQEVYQAVYEGFSFDRKYTLSNANKKLSERDLLDFYILAKSKISIAKTRKGADPKFTKDTTAKDFGRAIRDMEENIPELLMAEIRERASRHFDFAAEMLKNLRDEGLISKADYSRMKIRDYLTTKFLRDIDPVDTSLSSKSVTVGESGIQHFKKGSTKHAEVDTEALLAEHIIRVESRIARNRANQELFKIARDIPDNGVVRLAKGADQKAPEGFAPLKVRVEGKTHTMFMREPLFEQWTTNNSAITPTLANIARIVSGSAIVRPLATGYNPGFILVNLPRDIAHAWLTTGKTYSSFLPVYLGQIAKDLVLVAKDSWKKQGRYKEFIREGGGMNFLTHQGREAFVRSDRIRDRFTPSGAVKARMGHQMRATQEALSKLNEFSEIWVRLAIRERVLRNQKREIAQGLRKELDPEAATYMARTYLDFSQGGNFVKAADSLVPYLNAATQAVRTTARSIKTDPVRAGAKMMQMATVGASWATYNWLANGEQHRQIPAHTRYTHYIIHHPNLAYYDDNGNLRHAYTAIRKDESTLPFIAWPEMLVDRFMGQAPPTEDVVKTMIASLPNVSSIPTIQAYHTYVANQNFWFDEKIWKGRTDIQPYGEFTSETPAFWKLAGEKLNMSPERLQAAFKTLVPTNSYVGLGEYGYNLFSEIMADPEMQQPGPTQTPIGREVISTFVAENMLKDAPVLRRVLKWTHPATVEVDRAIDSASQANTIEEIHRREVNRLVRDASIQEALNYAKAVQRDDARLGASLVQTAERAIKFDAVVGKLKGLDQTIPSRVWWTYVSLQKPSGQAAAFYSQWVERDAAGRQKMLKLAAAFPEGFDDSFWQEFEKEKKIQGTERPPGILD